MRLNARKSPGTLVDAFAMLRARLNGGMPRLDVYGDGPYRSPVEAEVARLGIDDVVTLHGRVPMEQLPGLLAGSDLALVPSLPEPYMQYSLSTKLLEAVAMGIPVIASDLATFRAHFTPAKPPPMRMIRSAAMLAGVRS